MKADTELGRIAMELRSSNLLSSSRHLFDLVGSLDP
jgi:hypothetical protein